MGKGRGFADVTNLPKFLLIHIWYMKFASNGKGVAGICPSPCHSAGFQRAQGKNNLTVDAFFYWLRLRGRMELYKRKEDMRDQGPEVMGRC